MMKVHLIKFNLIINHLNSYLFHTAFPMTYLKYYEALNGCEKRESIVYILQLRL